ncbi:RfaG Glycosyltransferase [Rhabdaerophilaceae bacterium]
MVRLCILLGSVGLGGAQPATAALAEDLATAGFDLRFLCLGEPTFWPWPARPVSLGTRLANGLLPLREALLEFQPALVLSSLGIASLAIELARATMRPRFAHAAWVHGYPAQEYAQFESVAKQAITAACWRAIWRADRIVAVSNPLAAHLRESNPAAANRIHCVPNGPVRKASIASPINPRNATARPKHLLFAGRFAPDKAPLDAITAVAQLSPETVARLDFYGSGPLEAAMHAEIAARGLADRVAIHPPTSDLTSRMAAADALVLPSPIEPFGNIVIEAFSQGLPCIVRRGSGGPESLVPAGAQVMIADGMTVQDLAEAIRRTLASPVEPSILQAQAQRFTRDVHSAAMAELLHELAEQGLSPEACKV